MPENTSQAIRQWCDARLPEDFLRKLDQGEASPLPLYRDYTRNGWLACANIFEDAKNLKRMMERFKILSRYSSDLCNMVGVNSVCSMLLAFFGTEKQKQTAEHVRKGSKMLSFSLTEPEAGSDIFNLKTLAEPQKNGWVLKGKKSFATGAAMADFILVVARTDSGLPLNQCVCVFLVPKNAAGLTIIPQEKIATNGFSSCEITLNSVVLPEEAVVGDPNGAWGSIAFIGGVERLIVAATCVGLCQKMLSFLHDYAQNRMVQGKPLFDLQAINHELAGLAIKTKAADLMVEDAVRLLSEGKTPAVEICGAKVFASELQQEMSMAAMRIIGGRAYLKEFPVERWLREGLLALYAGGTNELQKNIIARKLPRTLVAL